MCVLSHYSRPIPSCWKLEPISAFISLYKYLRKTCPFNITSHVTFLGFPVITFASNITAVLIYHILVHIFFYYSNIFIGNMSHSHKTSWLGTWHQRYYNEKVAPCAPTRTLRNFMTYDYRWHEYDL